MVLRTSENLANFKEIYYVALSVGAAIITIDQSPTFSKFLSLFACVQKTQVQIFRTRLHFGPFALRFTPTCL